ncbi:uncharacterized protein BP5553_01199 [Venustampulla echinocandica]|uniref:Uncharacterized protein n=1 Tax=Venustampulla echinocandica TaxID=2656787 RepID=A0A370U0B6_9HELO|nr:uncharacterized protein BP5553_01199 [Venustampulla echinocandica]RDL41220.1 hypothetical protein BP5553_01199 [Venustampulla echinocandica]
MPSSIVPGLAAIVFAMFFQASRKKIALLPGRARAVASSLRQLPKPDALQPRSVLVEAHYNHPLSLKESEILARLQSNQQLLIKEAPDLVARISGAISKDLDKHDFRDGLKITNDLDHFQKVEMHRYATESRLQRLESSNQRLELAADNAFKQEVAMNRAELYKAIGIIQAQLRARGWGKKDQSNASIPPYKAQSQTQLSQTQLEAQPTASIPPDEAQPQTQLEAQAFAIRNRIAHALQLTPCLLLVSEEPALELVFNALFGLSSIEGKDLSQFDNTRSFHVDRILSLHAQLWKSGLASAFISPYQQWLEAMRSLQPKHNPRQTEPALVSFVEGLATEVCEKADADFKSATIQRLENPATMKKMLRQIRSKGFVDPYCWDKIVSGWEDRGLWQKVVVEWKL